MRLDTKSDVPIFQQIVDQIERQVLTGQLAAGDFIPSVRELAVKLVVNPNTVAKAYLLLQQKRLVEPVRGKGLVVNGIKDGAADKRRDELLQAKAKEAVSYCADLGFSTKDLVAAIRSLGHE